MTTSSANPQEMRAYVSAANGAHEDASEAVTQLGNAYSALQDAMPAGFTLPDLPDVAGPLGRTREVDAYVGTVAERFEEAGSLGADGVSTMDSALLASVPYTSRYSEQQRQELRRRAEQELARMREFITDGEGDETTTGELIGVLGWMRYEVDRAPTPEAKRQVARDLIDTMGAGDLHEALALLEGRARGLDDVDENSPPVLAIADLGYVVSLGLEGNRGRANDWAQRLADLRSGSTTYQPGHVPVQESTSGVDGMAVLGHYMADGTQTFGVALFDQLWAGNLGDDSLTNRLFGTTSTIHPMLMNAAENPRLANGIVNHLVDTTDPGPTASDHDDRNRFYELFGDEIDRADNPLWDDDEVVRDDRFEDIPRDLLGDVLASSVHPTLGDAPRIETAAKVTTHYLDTPPLYTYPDPVIRGLATTTQPLLENWEPVQGDDDGTLALPGYSADEVDQINRDLWHAIGRYGENGGGVEGLTSALSGATTHRLAEAHMQNDPAVQASSTHPFVGRDLTDLNRLYSTVATTVSRTRFGDVVAALEEGDVNWGMVHAAAMHDVLAGAAGPTSGLIEASFTYLEASEAQVPEVTDGTANPFYNLEIPLDVQLIDMTLAAHPDLQDALGDQLHDTAREGGPSAVVELVLDDPTNDPHLNRLRELVNDQIAAIDLHDAQDHFQATNPFPDEDD